MVTHKKPDAMAKEPKDLRYRNQYFPGAETLVFDTNRKGFVPLPIILRKILWYLTPPEVRVLIYLALRASKYGICYPTEEEIASDLGMKGRKNLTPHLRSLERKHFIKTHSAPGKKYFLILDPRLALQRLAEEGKLNEDQIFEINQLLGDLNQEPIPTTSKKGTP
jgi:DNA-binding MarR family transcriptional regulator